MSHRGRRHKRRRSSNGAWWKQEYGGMPAWAIVAATAVIAVLGAISVAGLSQSDASASAPRATLRPMPTAEVVEPDRIAVVGDSNTEVNSPDFADGKIGNSSWVRVLTSNGYAFAGGWADGGTSSTTQAQSLKAVENVDTLLVMTGTNDLGFGDPFEQTTANIDTMVDKVPADRIVLLAIAPRDEETTPSSVDYNAALRDLATERGWEFFDGMEFLRADGGGFADGMTRDGVHLTAEAQKRFGESVLEYLTP